MVSEVLAELVVVAMTSPRSPRTRMPVIPSCSKPKKLNTSSGVFLSNQSHQGFRPRPEDGFKKNPLLA
jgi:hypothetical protein